MVLTWEKERKGKGVTTNISAVFSHVHGKNRDICGAFLAPKYFNCSGLTSVTVLELINITLTMDQMSNV